MSTIRDIKSKLNQKTLDALCTKYHIPACVHPSLPGPDKNILQSLDGKIGVYTRFFDFANYRIPLSQFLVDVLDHFHIHFSQLSVFGADKVSHFEILCRVYGFQPSVNLFRAFYTSSYTKGWMSFIKRSDAAPVCHSKPLDSVKNWNDHFLWVDSAVFPFSVSLKSKILSKDPPPKLSQYETEACDFLRTHTAPFRKFLEPFLCWVGISRYDTLDENYYLTFWDGKDEMDLFTFIRHSDPTKVWVRKRNLAEREVKLLKMTKGRTVSLDPLATAASGDSVDSIDKLFDEEHDAGQKYSVEKDDDVLEEAISKDASETIAEKPQKKRKRKVAGDASGSVYPPKKLRDDHQSLPPNTSGKSLTTLRGMISKGDLPSGATEPLIVASLAPMPDVGPVDSISGLNLRTRPPHVRYVVSLDGFHHSNSYSEATSFSRSLVADAPVVTVVVTTTADANVATGSKVRDVSKDFENIGDSASASGVNADAVSVSKFKKPSSSSDSFYASQSLNTKTMHRVYIPRWKVTNDFILEDLYSRDLTDRLAPPALFTQLRAMDYDQLYSEFNVGAARHVCLGAEVKMRAEHTLEKKGELEDKCAEQTTLLLEKDAEIAHLKSLLSLKESKAAEDISLCSQLSVVEVADAAKGTELGDLKEKNFALEGERNALSKRVANLDSVTASKETEMASLSSRVTIADLSSFQLLRDELNSKVVSLESEMDCLVAQKSSLESAFELFRERIEALQDEQALALGNRVVELDAQLSKMAIHLDKEFHFRLLTTISGRRWFLSHGLKLVILKFLQSPEYLQALGQAIGCVVNKGIQDGLKVGIDHGKAGRDLSVESRKDASIADLMDSLRLEGVLAEIPRAEDLQSSPTQLMLPIYGPEDNVVFAETSLSSSLEIVSLRVLTGEASTSVAPITTLSTTFASPVVIPPNSVVINQVLDVEPHNEDPSPVTFEKEELSTSPE
ncbi:hypothetical protein Tco_0953020 [Tanacetum coccineum]|uniref:Transposase (putative) gypsy type domain-containing protein n=1 Tax=Tanacetum coccineum TaxID=301880 RepID=A0ABQ5DYY9_9ASTR